MKQNKKIINWSFAIIWMVLIFILSSIGDFSPVTGDDYQRTDLVSSIVHVVLYVILTFLLIRAFISSGVKKKKAVAYAFIVAVLYGITDEVHQYFVPGREMHLGDWLMDTIGAFIVVSFYKIKIKK